MLKQLVNECVIDLTLTPDGPILIKSGMPTISGPDMAFVTTWRNGTQEVYLPGSSLKGVLRSHAERIARTLNPAAACNPFSAVNDKKDDTFCGSVFEARKKTGKRSQNEKPGWPENNEEINQLVYRESCPICRLFGSTWYAGRLATADAYALGTSPRPQQRDWVGIDRFTGGAARGAKFDLEVVTEGIFKTRLHLRNFELWQLGLLGFVLTDLAEGLVRIGSGKSRGLGRVKGEVKQVRVDFMGPRSPKLEESPFSLTGVGGLVSEEMANNYGFSHTDRAILENPPAVKSNGLRATCFFDGATFPWYKVAPLWVKHAEQFQCPDGMLRYRRRGGR